MEDKLSEAAYLRVLDIASDLGMKVFWENTDLPPKYDQSHIRASIMPTRPGVIKTNGRTRRKWLLQISVYVRDGDGDSVVKEHVDAIVEAMPYGEFFVFDDFSFQRVGAAEPKPGVRSGAWYFVPVQFLLQAFR